MYSRTKDRAGQTFGRLTALYPNGRQKRVTIWRCRCQCGNEVDVRGSNLSQKVNPVTSCGCALGYEDLTGRKFSRWTVLRRDGNDSSRNARWLCRCECGHEGRVSSDALRHGGSQSCGCIVGESHGMSFTPEYAAWGQMIGRCYNPADQQFKNYGARGIWVCDEWRGSFSAFFAHVGLRPSDKHSIDRKNNNGHYEPGNVRWATKIEQANNTRRTVRVEQDGEMRPVALIARESGASPITVASRIKAGMPLAVALKKPKGRHYRGPRVSP